jgi:hypothetical protein
MAAARSSTTTAATRSTRGGETKTPTSTQSQDNSGSSQQMSLGDDIEDTYGIGSGSGSGRGGTSGSNARTTTTVYQSLRQAWLSERAAPELLLYETEMVALIRLAIAKQETMITNLRLPTTEQWIAHAYQVPICPLMLRRATDDMVAYDRIIDGDRSTELFIE